jgi:hypothetical protein
LPSKITFSICDDIVISIGSSSNAKTFSEENNNVNKIIEKIEIVLKFNK